jgi:electron transfer flavoprotein alpha subunit
MAGIYVYSDKASLAAELIGLAKQAGKPVNALAFDKETAEALAAYGPDKVYLIQGDSVVIENYAKPLVAFLKEEGAELFLVGATARGRDMAARIAGYLGCGLVSDVSSFAIDGGKVRCERLMYGGAVTQAEEIEGMAIVTVPAGKSEAVKGGVAEVITIQLAADKKAELVETACIVREGVDLAAADKIICIGLGMDKKEDMKMAVELADALGAAIGCTRSICEERKWLPNYIGISGETVKPSLYVAMGVSGQVQHVVGMRDAKVVVAINTNEKAPIFAAADYGIVGDMYEVVPLLTKEIKNT